MPGALPRSPRYALALAATMLTLDMATLAGCTASSPSASTGPQAAQPEHPHLVWISLDGAPPDVLRSLSSHGAPQGLQRLAQHALVFERAVSASGERPYAQAAALTSRYPSEIAPLLPQHFRFDADQVRLPRILGFYGYRTAAFWGDRSHAAAPACDYGFGSTIDTPGCGRLEHQAEAVGRWLDIQGPTPTAPLFVYVQGLDAWKGPRNSPQETCSHGCSGSADRIPQGLDALLGTLVKHGLTPERTLFVLTSPCGPPPGSRDLAAAVSGPASTWLDQVHVPLVLWGGRGDRPAGRQAQHEAGVHA